MNTRIENALEVIRKVKNAALNDSVEVLLATKTIPLTSIKEIVDNTPIKIAGENRVQELLSKFDVDITWDFIGQLQSNKVKYIIDKVRLIHSVDRLKLLKIINQEAKKANKVQSILIQLNTGKEASKAGLHAEQVLPFAQACLEYPNIKVEGLMAVTPFDINTTQRQKYFDEAYAQYDKLKQQYPNVKYLSMGMSNDYQQAIQSGANLVRIGSAIFGERN